MRLDFEANVDAFLYLIPFLAIDINASDIKALYRRSQALESLGKLDQAFKDVQRCATIEPRNKNFQETLRRLGAKIQEKLHVQFSTDARVQNMFEILLDGNSEKEKREKAANNLIVLGREEAGAERIFQNNGVKLLLQLIETKNAEMILAAVRTLSGMCTGHKARVSRVAQKSCLRLSLYPGDSKEPASRDFRMAIFTSISISSY
nr:protein unc-45 homolog B-like [Chrysemys picta bellii]